MRLRTFIAPTLSEAKEKVRSALGEDAIIVSTVNTPSGGVEIRAAVDSSQPSRASGPDKSALDDELERRIALQVLQHLRTDLSGSRRVAEQTATAVRQSQEEAQARAQEQSLDAAKMLGGLLARHGFADALAEKLAAAAEKAEAGDIHRALAGALETEFKFAPLPLAPSRPVLLAGPTGAGKTSMTAKLTARALMGGEPATIFGADVGRAGAVEQIRTYADALDAHFHAIETPEDLRRILTAGERRRGSSIIDTPGVNPFVRSDVEHIQELAKASEAELVVVLPASGDREEYADILRVFHAMGARRLIVTKFDATRRIGPALTAAHAAGLSLSHFGVSPFIADGVEVAGPDTLARRLLVGFEDAAAGVQTTPTRSFPPRKVES